MILESWDQVRLSLHADWKPVRELVDDVALGVRGKQFLPFGNVELGVSKRNSCTLKIIGVSCIVVPWGCYEPVQRQEIVGVES